MTREELSIKCGDLLETIVQNPGCESAGHNCGPELADILIDLARNPVSDVGGPPRGGDESALSYAYRQLAYWAGQVLKLREAE